MNAKVTLALVALAVAPLVGLADDQSKSQGAGTGCLSNFSYSREFLAKYPRAPSACREVQEKDGQRWARFEANVTGVRNKEVTADFIGNFGDKLTTLTFTAAPDARVQVGDKAEQFHELRRGDTLSFWVPEARAGMYAQPGILNTGKLTVIDTGAKER
jgi:hypothetical protein